MLLLAPTPFGIRAYNLEATYLLVCLGKYAWSELKGRDATFLGPDDNQYAILEEDRTSLNLFNLKAGPQQFTFESEVDRKFSAPIESSLLYVISGKHIGLAKLLQGYRLSTDNGLSITTTTDGKKFIKLKPNESALQVKALHFKGSGKHKYSFRRIEVPSYPIHFCDCEEHCGPPEAANDEYASVLNTTAFAKEHNITNSVMSKLFEKEDEHFDSLEMQNIGADFITMESSDESSP
ncbi:hypothetical protein ABZP36_030394 [Zizania latifolia]